MDDPIVEVRPLPQPPPTADNHSILTEQLYTAVSHSSLSEVSVYSSLSCGTSACGELYYDVTVYHAVILLLLRV
jgi:hypothetical protein